MGPTGPGYPIGPGGPAGPDGPVRPTGPGAPWSPGGPPAIHQYIFRFLLKSFKVFIMQPHGQSKHFKCLNYK